MYTISIEEFVGHMYILKRTGLQSMFFLNAIGRMGAHPLQNYAFIEGHQLVCSDYFYLCFILFFFFIFHNLSFVIVTCRIFFFLFLIINLHYIGVGTQDMKTFNLPIKNDHGTVTWQHFVSNLWKIKTLLAELYDCPFEPAFLFSDATSHVKMNMSIFTCGSSFFVSYDCPFDPAFLFTDATCFDNSDPNKMNKKLQEALSEYVDLLRIKNCFENYSRKNYVLITTFCLGLFGRNFETCSNFLAFFFGGTCSLFHS
ncbi:hypothetical protein ACJX0J_031529, partial [Zea mays]